MPSRPLTDRAPAPAPCSWAGPAWSPAGPRQPQISPIPPTATGELRLHRPGAELMAEVVHAARTAHDLRCDRRICKQELAPVSAIPGTGNDPRAVGTLR